MGKQGSSVIGNVRAKLDLRDAITDFERRNMAPYMHRALRRSFFLSEQYSPETQWSSGLLPLQPEASIKLSGSPT